MALTPPPKGCMYLFDFATPPLKPGSYRMHTSTDVTVQGKPQPLADDRFFDVVGPRFTLAPTEVAGVFPPRNGHGPFSEALPQIAIKRRTLPWERPLDDKKPIPAPSDGQGLPPSYPTPFLALLLFEEGEYILLQGAPLENVVPKAVFQRLGSPQNILCDAVEADASLVDAIMPSKEELQLLTHVRWVNKDDRELSVEGSDGWFAIVMSNRLPSPGTKCRACLVSLEERSDLVPADPPAASVPVPGIQFGQFLQRDAGPSHKIAPRFLEASPHPSYSYVVGLQIAKTRLVLLDSWQFTSEGNGTFFDHMQGLDVGLLGKVDSHGQPALADTAHLRISLKDRAGTDETAWYRGPLVPFELTRDPLGPYHSADQARRATPETGVEDVSYASAFEVGRLLAAADARLAQELMRWRRESYQQAARSGVLIAIQKEIKLDMPAALAEQLHTVLTPVVATAAIGEMVKGSGPIADRYGITTASKTPGMSAEAVKEAWGLGSLLEAQVLLGQTPATLGTEAPAIPQTKRPNVTLEAVASDGTSLQTLNAARDRILQGARIRGGG
jgi:hypothetical protein